MRKKKGLEVTEEIIESGVDIPEIMEPLFKKPDLFEWQPTLEETYFYYDSDSCRASARFEEFYGITKDNTPISKFKIKQGLSFFVIFFYFL